MFGERLGDLTLELLDLGDQRPEQPDQGEHELPAGMDFDLAGATFRGAAKLAQQLRRGLAPAVVLATEERRQPLLAERSGLDRAWILLQERQRDRAVERAEDLDRSRPEAFQLGPQLVS